MDEGVPDADAPRPIILRDVEPAPIFLGDINSLEEILEPKRNTFDILDFVVGFVFPPALFVISLGLFFITENWAMLLLAIISGSCIWPLAGTFLSIIAFKQEKKEQAIGALISLIIWIFAIIILLS